MASRAVINADYKVTAMSTINSPRTRVDDAMRQIVDRLDQLAQEQARRRKSIETRWLENLRAFHGRYEAETEAQLKTAKKSRAFVKITRKKTNAWIARLQELLFPTDDRNWGIRPTPVPELSKQAKDAIARAKAKLAAANDMMPADAAADPDGSRMAAAGAAADEAVKAAAEASTLEEEIEAAKKAGEAMQDVMDDQLIECMYPIHARDAIQDACRIGTGIIKGPLVGDRTRGSWVQGENGYEYTRSPDPAPVFVWVNPWNYLPEMSATRPEELEFEFERHLWTKKMLRRLVRDAGFNADAVRRLLRKDVSGPVSNSGLYYLADLRAINGEGEQITDRYVGYEYHGPLECHEVATMMRAMAYSAESPEETEAMLKKADEYELADDPLDEKRVIIFFCEGEVLKVTPEYVLDSGESLYSSFTFEPGESSIFGYGVPDIMSDSQRAINGGWRMAMDNAGLSVGPQIVIDMEAMEPANGSWQLEPRKVWKMKQSAGRGPNNQPFQVHNIPQNISEILTIVREAHIHADDETALPVVSEGEGPEVGNESATAASIRQNGSNVTFRRVVRAYDDGITVPAMRRLYDWNMQFNKRDDIKGDMGVDARGTSVLLVREVQSQTMMAIATNWSTHPVISKAIKVYDTLKKTLQTMMITPNDILVTEDEFQKRIAAELEQPQPDPPEVIAAKAGVEKATIDADSRIKVAEIQREIKMMELVQAGNISMEQYKAMLVKADMDNRSRENINAQNTQHKERVFAAELGAERQMADEARARGEEPDGSGGYISAGGKPGNDKQ